MDFILQVAGDDGVMRRFLCIAVTLVLMGFGVAHANDPFLQEAGAAKKPAPAANKSKRKRLTPRRSQRRLVTLPAFRPGGEIKIAINQPETLAPAAPLEKMDKSTPDADPPRFVPKDEAMGDEVSGGKLKNPVAQAGPKVSMKAASPKMPGDIEVASEEPPVSLPHQNEAGKAASESVEAKQDTLNPRPAEPKDLVATKTSVAKPKAEEQLEPLKDPSPSSLPQIDSDDSAASVAKSTTPKSPATAAASNEDAAVIVAKTEAKAELGDISVIEITDRPKTFTKALADRRLSKLPGVKSRRFKKDEVIAIRHHALMLLANNECTGIAEGGRAATPGLLYVRCTDDPTFIRQFPLEEQTW